MSRIVALTSDSDRRPLPRRFLKVDGQAVGEAGEHGVKAIFRRDAPDSVRTRRCFSMRDAGACVRPGVEPGAARLATRAGAGRPGDVERVERLPRVGGDVGAADQPGPGERHAELVQQPGPVLAPAPRSPWRRSEARGTTRPARLAGRAARRPVRGVAVRLGASAPVQGLQRRAVAAARRRRPRASAAASGGVAAGGLDLPLVGRDALDGAQDRRCAPTRPGAASSPAVSANSPSRSGRRRRPGARRRAVRTTTCGSPRDALATTVAGQHAPGLGGAAPSGWSVVAVMRGRAPSTSRASEPGPPVGPGGRARRRGRRPR